MSESKIAQDLADEVERARAEFLRVGAVEGEIVREPPNGLPRPARKLRTQSAARALKRAFWQYERAAKRYRDYLERGILPEAGDSEGPNPER